MEFGLSVWQISIKAPEGCWLLCDSTRNPAIPRRQVGLTCQTSKCHMLNRTHQYALESASEVLPHPSSADTLFYNQVFCLLSFCFLNDRYFKIIDHLFLAALDHHGCMPAFSVAVHGLVLQWLLLLWAHRLRIHRLQQLTHGSWGVHGMVHRLSCSMTYGIFLDQGSMRSPALAGRFYHWTN